MDLLLVFGHFTLHTQIFFKKSDVITSGTSEMNEYEFTLPQLTSGESQDKLRRVDSNRKSRGFSKQPSTGDYYKTLGQDVAEPRGSRGMAPNEEVSQKTDTWGMFVF